MLDNRIYTFLDLCKTMNYRKTAENLFMTQPAVTQHIKYIEKYFNCKLFNYEGKVLSKTDEGKKLEIYIKQLVSTNNLINDKMSKNSLIKINMGVSKTIGEYLIKNSILDILKNDSIQLNLSIDNTEQLLKKLNNFELDFLILEGYFNKNIYSYKKISTEEIVGICSKNHKFASKELDIDQIFNEHIILREEGSGTRSIFENFIFEKNYSLDSFKRKSIISSYKIIEEIIESNVGISFMYESVIDKNRFATFKIKNKKMEHEFNYVFLIENTDIHKHLDLIKLSKKSYT